MLPAKRVKPCELAIIFGKKFKGYWVWEVRKRERAYLIKSPPRSPIIISEEGKNGLRLQYKEVNMIFPATAEQEIVTYFLWLVELFIKDLPSHYSPRSGSKL
jgi:hypothetical protein